MKTCKECIHFNKCEGTAPCLMERQQYTPCLLFDPSNRYIKMPCAVGDTIYFTGYGIVEELIVEACHVELNRVFIDECIGYVDARRYNGSCESIGFNVFGELAFTIKEEAEESLNKPEATDED